MQRIPLATRLFLLCAFLASAGCAVSRPISRIESVPTSTFFASSAARAECGLPALTESQLPAVTATSAPPPVPGAARPHRHRGQIGDASYYDGSFNGRTTANGDTYDGTKLTAAHRSLAFGTRVRVTNLENERTVVVVVNDRGPYVGGRIIDLSKRAARLLGFEQDGTTRVRVQPL